MKNPGCEPGSVLQAFSIIANNVLRVAAINSVGDFVLFLGKVGVMAATAAIGVVWFKVQVLRLFKVGFSGNGNLLSSIDSEYPNFEKSYSQCCVI